MTVGLLDQLRNEDPEQKTNERHRKWSALPQILVELLPDYRHGKTVLIRGEVIVIGSVLNIGQPRHFYAVLHNEATAQNPAGSEKFPHHAGLPPRPGQARPAAMGVSRYRAESETNYYTDPFVGWADHDPAAFAGWIAQTLQRTDQETPAMEAKKLL